MASIGWEGDRARIVYRDGAGKQQSLRLGKCSNKAAQSALAGFERVLEAHRIGSTIHPDGVRWLEAINDRLHARVVKLGLVEGRKGAPVVTLGELLDRFDAAAVVKSGTRTTYLQALGMLREYFGDARPVAAITAADADEWRKTIGQPVSVKGNGGEQTTKQLASATVAKRVRVAKAVFRKAVKWGLIPTDPFADLRAGSQSNPDRAFYVDAESVQAILAACPDDDGAIAVCRAPVPFRDRGAAVG